MPPAAVTTPTASPMPASVQAAPQEHRCTWLAAGAERHADADLARRCDTM